MEVGGFSENKNLKVDILLVPIGEIDPKVIQMLRVELEKRFKKSVSIAKSMPEPHFAFNKNRNQYYSTMILNSLMKEKEYLSCEKILGIFDHDLYVPDLNFVFGEATKRVAIISLTRLRQEFYNLPRDQIIFYRRLLTEAIHELGHTYGLEHCKNPDCVMFFSNSLMDTDRKGPNFCQRCKNKIFWIP